MGINLKYRKTVSLILVPIFALVFSFCGDENEAVDSPLTVEDRLEEMLGSCRGWPVILAISRSGKLPARLFIIPGPIHRK
jgi:hypothetical protein